MAHLRAEGWRVGCDRSGHLALLPLWVTRGLERRRSRKSRPGRSCGCPGRRRSPSATRFSAPEVEAPALPPLEIEEPTVSMFFLVNTGPFAGEEGSAVTLRQIKERLERELRVNVALRVEDLGRPTA